MLRFHTDWMPCLGGIDVFVERKSSNWKQPTTSGNSSCEKDSHNVEYISFMHNWFLNKSSIKGNSSKFEFRGRKALIYKIGNTAIASWSCSCIAEITRTMKPPFHWTLLPSNFLKISIKYSLTIRLRQQLEQFVRHVCLVVLQQTFTKSLPITNIKTYPSFQCIVSISKIV